MIVVIAKNIVRDLHTAGPPATLAYSMKMAGYFGTLCAVFLFGLVACSSAERADPNLDMDSEPGSSPVSQTQKDEPLAQSTLSTQDPSFLSKTQPAAPETGSTATNGDEATVVTTAPAISAAPTTAPWSSQPTTTPSASEKTAEPSPPHGSQQVIGSSFGNRPITSYHFGSGSQKVVFIGGIHGGYEWNTVLLAYEAIDYFLANPDAVPQDVSLIIIPSANPDGLFRITGKEGRFEPADLAYGTFVGRYNAQGVDLNRNWDCDWEAVAWWQDQPVSGGRKAFSEPETRALRDFIIKQNPRGVVFWHSSADGVFGAGCEELFQPARNLAEVYGSASGYPVADQFGYYEVSGDAGDWLSTQGIPSITVELESHDLIEWPENLAGMAAVLDYYNEPHREAAKPLLE